jgi:hypothetical protein
VRVSAELVAQLDLHNGGYLRILSGGNLLIFRRTPPF